MWGSIYKVGFVICRQSGLFSLPLLNRIRNFFYRGHLCTSDIHVDDFARIGPAHLTKATKIEIAPGLRVGRNAEIDSSGGITIGKRVTISEDAKIYTHDHVVDGDHIDWRRDGLRTSTLNIEDDAWIGAGAIVLSRVTRIGRGAIVASGSVVRSDVDDFTIVAGNPARAIRKRKVNEDMSWPGQTPPPASSISSKSVQQA